MSLRILGLIMGVAITLLNAHDLLAQTPSQNSAQAREMRRMGAMMMELQRLTNDAKLAQEMNVSAEQKRELQLASQKFSDAVGKMRRNSGTFDTKKYQELQENLMLDIEDVLTSKQSSKLSDLAKEREKQYADNMLSEDQRFEMRKLSSLMMELQRLAYDQQLAEELGVTAEQRVQIREASQKFSRAMMESRKANESQGFDVNGYRQVVGDLMMEAQDILTPRTVGETDADSQTEAAETKIRG